MAAIEDILEVYQRPYDPLRPVVCIDETNKQLIKEIRVQCEPGSPEKVDSVYVRNEAADVFLISKPLADINSFRKQVRIWTVKRNSECRKINWQFTTSDAMIKLAKLYQRHSKNWSDGVLVFIGKNNEKITKTNLKTLENIDFFDL